MTPLIDADGHVVEVDREIWEYLPAPFHGAVELFSLPFFPTLDGWHRSARRIADGRPQAALPQTSAEDWLSYLDEAGISASVLFPTAGLGFGLVADPDWAVGLAHAYNDWLYDRYLKPAPNRLKGVALIPLQDVPSAVAELRRAVQDLGMVGGILPAAGLPDAFGERKFWPVYEAAQELGVMLAVHGAPAYGLGLERLRKLIEVRSLTHPFSQMVQLVSMMFNGVFDAFPRLRVAYCEAGAGWAPYIMDRLDMEYQGRRKQAPDLKVPPSEHLKGGNIFFHAELDEAGLGYAVQCLGENAFFCASDYPHEPKHELGEKLEGFEARQDLPEQAKRRILWDNPIRLYNFREQELTVPAQAAAARA
jgi:predicted TIM-barrel fold metal-dependent hydrolase